MGLGLGITDMACRGVLTPGVIPPVRIPKGSSNGWGFGSAPLLPIAGVSLQAGSTLVVLLSGNNTSGSIVKWGTDVLTNRGERVFGAAGTLQAWTRDNVVAGTKTITPTMTVGVADQGAAMIAFEVQGLKNPSLDAVWSNAGTGTGPIVTASVPTAQANEILIAAVGDNGQNGQALGTWGNGFTQGQNNGSAGGFNDTAINEGYRTVNGVGTFTADDTGRNSLDWAMLLIALKGN